MLVDVASEQIVASGEAPGGDVDYEETAGAGHGEEARAPVAEPPASADHIGASPYPADLLKPSERAEVAVVAGPTSAAAEVHTRKVAGPRRLPSMDLIAGA